MKLYFLFGFIVLSIVAQPQIPYGSNKQAGKYADVGGTKIYYETYGKGIPVVLLHGSVYGYIDEYSSFIPELEQNFKVIAIALRGHGKSEIGKEDFSYKLLAEDVMTILKQEAADSALVIGFSAGAITGYYLAANYPKSIKKLVTLAGALDSYHYRPEAVKELQNLNIHTLKKRDPSFIANRQKLMPQPERFGEMINRFKKAWFSGNFIAPAQPNQIQCPVLIIGGDRDFYFPVTSFVSDYKQIKQSQLAIIPQADHVDMIRKPFIITDLILPFLMSK
ncbi:MAG: alpha/beta hydrolase [Flavisolibacter sp.]|nr:alpha/beta hydrolase [Flavisolibacter sp.]